MLDVTVNEEKEGEEDKRAGEDQETEEICVYLKLLEFNRNLFFHLWVYVVVEQRDGLEVSEKLVVVYSYECRLPSWNVEGTGEEEVDGVLQPMRFFCGDWRCDDLSVKFEVDFLVEDVVFNGLVGVRHVQVFRHVSF